MTNSSLLDVDEYLSSSSDNKFTINLQHLIPDYAELAITDVRGPHDLHTCLPANAYPILADHDNRYTFERAARRLFDAIQTRTSSRADDELIVIATYLDLPLSLILAHSGDAKVIALMQAMPSMPKDLMFAEGRRLETPGFRWCPRNFTRATGGKAIPGSDPDQDFQMWPAAMLDEQSRGLWWFGAAIKLEKLFQYEGDRIWPILVFELSGTLYLFEPSDRDSIIRGNESSVDFSAALERMLLATTELVILTRGPVPGRERVFIGALVEPGGAVEDAEHEGGLMGQYIMPGTIEPAHTGGHYAAEVILDAMRANGHAAGKYHAENIEPQYWLVD